MKPVGNRRKRRWGLRERRRGWRALERAFYDDPFSAEKKEEGETPPSFEASVVRGYLLGCLVGFSLVTMFAFVMHSPVVLLFSTVGALLAGVACITRSWEVF